MAGPSTASNVSSNEPRKIPQRSQTTGRYDEPSSCSLSQVIQSHLLHRTASMLPAAATR